jgi:hypothetical protein
MEPCRPTLPQAVCKHDFIFMPSPYSQSMAKPAAARQMIFLFVRNTINNVMLSQPPQSAFKVKMYQWRL